MAHIEQHLPASLTEATLLDAVVAKLPLWLHWMPAMKPMRNVIRLSNVR